MGTEAKTFSGIDDKYAQMLEEQEAKALQDAAQSLKDGPSQPGKRKDKRTPLGLNGASKEFDEPKDPPSTSPHVNSAFTEIIVCEYTTIIYPGTGA